MTDRIAIEITGDLPDKGKHAILAAAESAAEKMAGELAGTHDLILTVTVRSIRPGKAKTGAAPMMTAPDVMKPVEITHHRHDAAAD